MSYPAPAGPLLLGYVFSLGLHGVLTVQLYLYHAAFPHDSKLIKTLVYSVYLVETARSILMAYDAYDTFVIGFADKDTIELIRHIWFTCCIGNGILGSVVQGLYAYRIKMLSKSYVWGLSIAFLSLIQLIGALMAGVGAKFAVRLDRHLTYEFVGYIITKISAAVCDILIAVLMTFYLLKMRKKSRMAEDVITGIIRLIVEAGTLTSLFALLDVICFFTDYKYYSSWALRLIVGKLYSNSMMVVFNNRFSIRNNRYDYDSEVTWKSNFLVSTVMTSVGDTTTHISFNHAGGSGTRSQGRSDTGIGANLQPGDVMLSRTSSISTNCEVGSKSRA